MKTIFSILLFLACLSGFAQDTNFQKSNPQAKNEAMQITNTYDKELALTGKQQLLFQKKVEEFLIRRKKIENELNGEAKLKTLFKMQEEETKEMNNILSRPQMEVYKKLKPTIQPVETIKKE